MMNRVLLIVSACFVLGSASWADEPGGLSNEQVQRLLQSVPADNATRAATNAATNNDLKELALNHDLTAVSDDVFTFSLPTKGITDQENTGRCWMFAGLNILRQEVIRRYQLDDFELSQSYMAFWDRLEKCNVFLEFIIETRDRPLTDRELDHMLDDPVSDGGYWGYVVNLVEKYGVVPKPFMGETKSSSDTKRLDYVLHSLLRRDAAELRDAAARRTSVAELRRRKMAMLEQVMKVLVITYGRPPHEFLWRVVGDSGTVTETMKVSPQQFYRTVIGLDLADYVSLADFPVHPYREHYSIRLTKAMADKPDITFINVDMPRMKEIALRALLDSTRVWFGCDMGHDVHGKKGLMAKGLVDYESLLGVPLAMTKEKRLDYRNSSSNHAMVLVGVDIVDGKPSRWRVENSWGDERGDKGFFTMTDAWFDEYVLNVIVPKRYVPEDLLAVLRRPPVELPVWDPAWQGMRW